MSFEIKLPLFQGPFDLLLFFIERDELDIYDIPISRITGEFLDYLRHLESLNIEVASDFILVAATLMRIKSRMLLPRPQINEEGKEIDPREELVQHLLEYKKYKLVATSLAEMETEQLARYERGNVLDELKSIAKKNGADFDLQHLDLFKLLKTFQKVMLRFAAEQTRPKHIVVQYPYTIEGQKEWIFERLNRFYKLSFTEVLTESNSKIVAIYTFLAILELLQLEHINLTIGEGYNNFWIMLKEGQPKLVV